MSLFYKSNILFSYRKASFTHLNGPMPIMFVKNITLKAAMIECAAFLVGVCQNLMFL